MEKQGARGTKDGKKGEESQREPVRRGAASPGRVRARLKKVDDGKVRRVSEGGLRTPPTCQKSKAGGGGVPTAWDGSAVEETLDRKGWSG